MHASQSELRERALAARDKKAALGDDLDLSQFVPAAAARGPQEDLCGLSDADQKRLLMSGVDVTGKDRAGTFLMMDTSTVHCHTTQEGLEVMPIRQALEHHPWVRDYYMNLVQVDTDKYTAAAFLDLHDGYLIRALPGSKSVYPLQACLYMDQDRLQQNVHNILIAEEGSELHIISGCATSPNLKTGLHVGITEFYVKKNAKLSFTMIHNWAEGMAVRPRSAARVEEGGLFLSNYVSMKPVHSLQTYPTAHLVGKNATARFYSIVVGTPTSDLDMGSRVLLNEPGCRAEIVSRAITGGGRIMARGHLVGNAPGVKAHLECKGLILKGGSLLAVPELEGHVEGVEMSHEAAVGKIAQEEINYLMSRGLDEDQATATIVRGFLSVDIPGLPPALQAEMDQAVASTDQDTM